MSITTSCMVVNLSIGMWTGQKFDRTASAKVNGDAAAQDNVARVNKSIVDPAKLADIKTAMGSMRTHYYSRTVPWRDNGDRLLKRTAFDAFIGEHERLKAAFDMEVGKFLKCGYAAALEEAEFRMGKLWNPDDYPTAKDLGRKFYAELEIQPVMEAGDFRCQLSAEHTAAIKQQIERNVEARVARGMADVWTRLADALGHFASKMGSDEIFRDTTVSNLKQIAATIPTLNIADDVTLNNFAGKIEKLFGHLEPKELRKNPKLRNDTAIEAAAILAEMEGYINMGDDLDEAA